MGYVPPSNHQVFAWSEVSGEDMHFQHPETRKNQLFRIFSNFSRHGSSGCSTELSKTCKIRILKKFVQLRIQLRGSAAVSTPSRKNPCLKMSKDATKPRDLSGRARTRRGGGGVRTAQPVGFLCCMDHEIGSGLFG